MPSTRIPGITVNAAGHHIIDKEHRRVRIYARLGAVSKEEAQQRLAAEMERVEQELQRKAARPRFADAAARYLEESRDLRSADVTAWHVRLLTRYIGTLELHRIHDRTLERFIADRLADGVTATTINRSLEVVRSVLNSAARSYRDDEGRPWLEGMPPLITMLPESPSTPYPITWEEQDRLFPKLPARLARMALFAVNTGLRESNVCRMNNTAWQRARREAGLSRVRVHDLRHTFACRLRAVGVSMEDREVLLGHANHSMAGHYASADVGRLLKQANLILDREETRTAPRVANAGAGLWTKGPAQVPQQEKRAHLRLVTL